MSGDGIFCNRRATREGAGLLEKNRIVQGKPRGSGLDLQFPLPFSPCPAPSNLGSGLWVVNPEAFSVWVCSGWGGFSLP